LLYLRGLLLKRGERRGIESDKGWEREGENGCEGMDGWREEEGK